MTNLHFEIPRSLHFQQAFSKTMYVDSLLDRELRHTHFLLPLNDFCMPHIHSEVPHAGSAMPHIDCSMSPIHSAVSHIDFSLLQMDFSMLQEKPTMPQAYSAMQHVYSPMSHKGIERGLYYWSSTKKIKLTNDKLVY